MTKVDALEVGQRLGRFKASCRGAGVKLTHQRLEIFREVAASLEHPDAETVYRGVRERMPTVSLDTVYRTLWLLSDLGLVTTLGPRGASVRFDANLKHHHHYACVRCGLTRDFDSPELSALRIPDAATAFGSVVSTRVEVRGLCAACAKAAAPRSRAGAPKRSHLRKRRI
jgi:Fur family peroxide stress response transcriptional regulator